MKKILDRKTQLNLEKTESENFDVNRWSYKYAYEYELYDISTIYIKIDPSVNINVTTHLQFYN